MEAVVPISLILCIFIYIVWKLTNLTRKRPKLFRYYFNYTAFYSATMFISTLILPFGLTRPKNVLNARLCAMLIKYITKILNIDIDFHLRNGEILAEDRGAVIISNHQSSFDILGMFYVWDVGNKIAAIAKRQLIYFWPFGLSAYLCGVVFIDRRDVNNTYNQLEQTSKIMIKDKTKIWIFPEGTRNSDGKKFLPFKKGAFNIAVKAQVPILPIVYSPYYFIDPEKKIFNRGRIIMQCLEPVHTTGLTLDDVPALSEKLRKIMLEAYDTLRDETTRKKKLNIDES